MLIYKFTYNEQNFNFHFPLEVKINKTDFGYYLKCFQNNKKIYEAEGKTTFEVIEKLKKHYFKNIYNS